ncbi:site-specific integrase [Helicobacter pylori]|uniref:site-specific integrase n=1 Tax=Helicobacter pylori TaxID=210 RepID=UPI000EB512F8|nr:site-specific integrase [Helicobacter pylori]
MHNHTIYLRGNAFYLNYTKNSKRHRTSLNKLIKSLNLENDKALEYLEGLSLEKILKMQKGALKPNKEPKQESQRTAKKIKKDTSVKQVKESFKVSKITKESVINYHNNAFKKYKKNTLVSLNSLLKSFLEFCEQEGYTNKKNAKEGEKIDPFSLNEIKAILNSTPDLRLKAFLTTAFLTGLRTGEQLALLWSDIDFENKKINIDKSLNLSGVITSPKNKPSIREVDLLEPVEKILKELKATEPANKKMIFLNIPKRTQYFQRAFKKLLEALNLKDRKLYATRHTFASLSQGEEAMWVSKTLGHKDLNTTYSTYARYIPQQEKERAKFLKGLQ